MGVKFSPIFNHQVVDSAGDPATGWKIYTYVEGSSTPATTYTTSIGDVAQSNPIIINSLGFPTTGQIWLTESAYYKLVLTDAAGVVQKTEDNIYGVNDISDSQTEWVSGPTPTYVSGTSFTLVGDQTTAFHVGRRLKTTNSAGTIYSTITVSAYTSLTTVTVVNDSGTLDSGLSAVSYGLLSATNPSTPLLGDAYPIIAGSADPTKKVRLEVDGLTTATTRVLTIQDANDTLVGRATTDTLTNKSINLTNNTLTATSAQLATAVSDETGSGALVFATSPTLVTPALGTPASGVLTNCTGLPQSGLKTTSGTVVQASGTSGNNTLPGGAYGFYPNIYRQGNEASAATIASAFTTQTATCNIFLDATTGATTFTASQRYVQSSPPYNLGGGDIGLFIFALMDSLGNIRQCYVAPDPPWAYNGPTDTRADYYQDGKGFQKPRLSRAQRLALRDPSKKDAVLQQLAETKDIEITQAIKNADMGLIPHPFLCNDLTGCSVVLLDPTGALCDVLAVLHGHGDEVAELVMSKDIVFDNTPLDAPRPTGVLVCRASFR